MSTNDVNVASANNAGNVTNDPATGAPAGQSYLGQEGVNYEEQYRQLEGKMGSMGKELGEYRTFFQNISPVLEKLDQNPDLVQAIVDGKIDEELVKAVGEGKIEAKEAAVVSQVGTEVIEGLGEKKIKSLSSEEVLKLIESKAGEIRTEFEEKSNLKEFEEKSQSFIEQTSDFADYAEEIDKWLDQHDVTDIEIAYWAVKGKMSEEQASKTAEELELDRNKDLAGNAGGGGVTAQTGPDGVPIIDKLVGGPTNPLI